MNNKIDLVYTWVNNFDPSWRGEFIKWRDDGDNKSIRNRFNNCDEIYYSILSAKKYAKKVIRNIYIVVSTASQILDTKLENMRDIKIITHRDIFPTSKYLPTFNSVSIELHIHRIEGLSENYLYFNDDMFFGNYVQLQDFMQDGKALIFLDRETRIPKNVKFDSYHFNTAINYTDNILDKLLTNGEERHLLQHLPYVHNRNCDREIYNYLNNNKLYESTCTRFRENNNIKTQSLFYPYYSIHKGYSKAHYRKIGIKISDDHHLHYDRIINSRPKLYCLNKLEVLDSDLLNFYKIMNS